MAVQCLEMVVAKKRSGGPCSPVNPCAPTECLNDLQRLNLEVQRPGAIAARTS